MRRAQLRDKAFLEELSAFADAQRTLIQAECDGFDTDPGARLARVERAHNDFRFFCRTYFPHYIKGDESLFQKWFYDNFPLLIDKPSGQLVDLSAPRGEAKSTLGTQLGTLWCLLTERKHFMPIVMDSWDQAATLLEAIKTELTDNPRLRMDYPGKAGKGRVWQAGVFLSVNNRKVQAFGSAKKMRGIRHGPHRPDLVWLDDIENDENVRSLTQRQKIESWVLKTVLNLGPPEGTMDVLYLNTILHYDSVANRFHAKPRWVRRKFKSIVRWPDRMDLWQEWEELFLNEASGESEDAIEQPSVISAADAFYAQHKAEMDAGAIVSWPSVRPLIELMKIRAEDHHAFDCEHQNDPTNTEHAFFTNMQFWVVPQRDWVFYGSHDPSLGRHGTRRDPSATLVGGHDRLSGKLCVVEAKVARRLIGLQISHIIQFQRDYQCLAWAFEAVQFQEVMRMQLVAESAKCGVPVPAVAVIPSTDKELRIESISPHVNNGLILFHQAHTVLNTQVRHWPEADHDDGPDALEMLWVIATKRIGGVPRIRTGKRKEKALTPS